MASIWLALLMHVRVYGVCAMLFRLCKLGCRLSNRLGNLWVGVLAPAELLVACVWFIDLRESMMQFCGAIGTFAIVCVDQIDLAMDHWVAAWTLLLGINKGESQHSGQPASAAYPRSSLWCFCTTVWALVG